MVPVGCGQSLERIISEKGVGGRLVRRQAGCRRRLHRYEVLLQFPDAQALPGLCPPHALRPRDLLAAAPA